MLMAQVQDLTFQPAPTLDEPIDVDEFLLAERSCVSKEAGLPNAAQVSSLSWLRKS